MLKKIIPVVLAFSVNAFAQAKIEIPNLRKSAEARYVYTVIRSLSLSACQKFSKSPFCNLAASYDLKIPYEYATYAQSYLKPECGPMTKVYSRPMELNIKDRDFPYDDFKSHIKSGTFTFGATSFEWVDVRGEFRFCVNAEGQFYYDIQHYNRVKNASPSNLKANQTMTSFSQEVAQSLVKQYGFNYDAASLSARWMETWLTKVYTGSQVTSPQELEQVYKEMIGVSYLDLVKAVKYAGYRGNTEYFGQLVKIVSQKFQTSEEKARDFLFHIWSIPSTF